MGHSRRLVPAVLLLFLLLVSSEMGMNTVEGRTCETLSEKFKGPCVSDRNCANVCRGEGGGFDGGVCKGFRRWCFCTRPCRDS